MPIHRPASAIQAVAKLNQAVDTAGMIPIRHDNVAAALALNNAHAVELSLQTPESFRALLDAAFHAVWTEGEGAFLIAVDQGAAYISENFRWFQARYPRFVYVDRVVVAPAHRGQGLAKALYADLTAKTRAAGHNLITCEVNSDPPNPASDAFHAALGFRPVGQAALAAGAKTVRYLALEL
jgi:uncharacterized protein